MRRRIITKLFTAAGILAAIAGGPCLAQAPSVETPAQPSEKQALKLLAPTPVPPEQLAAAAKEIFRNRCSECHGGPKAADGIRILDLDLVVNKKKKIVPGKPDESPLMQLIAATEEPMMPPPSQPRLGAEDIATIRQWIAAGAPAFPEDVAPPAEANKDPALKAIVGVDYVLKTILAHVRTVPVEERQYIRYFSINHLLNGGATQLELDLHRDALAKAINHLTWEIDLYRPLPIDRAGTVFAIDLRKLGWHKKLYDRYPEGKLAGKSPLNLFDLALLEYPYGAIFEDSETYDQLVEEFFLPSGMVRPIAYVRGDWFCSTATLPPLYEDFLQLPHEFAELEHLLGVDVEANRVNYIARRAGMTVSGVSRNNRVVERHPTRGGYLWISFDFASSKGQGNIFKNPIDLHPNGGEMIFNLPNGLQGYFVSNHLGRRIDAAPTSIVTDRFAEDKTVRNGLSCMRCHEQGMKGFLDNVRLSMDRLPGSVGFDKRAVLNLYPQQPDMDQFLKRDSEHFQAAMKQVLGKPQLVEPLYPVTHRFLDAPLQLHTVSAELGLVDPEGLPHLFRTPQFAGLGLVPLATGGIIRRDMWEDYYDQVVRGLGYGIPVVPLDGLTRLEYPTAPPYAVDLATTKKGNVVAAGDEFAIVVTNSSKLDLYIELIGTSAKGEQVVLVPATTVVKSGAKYRYPEKGNLKVQAGTGREIVTLYACEAAFPAGELLRGKGLTDRVVHGFYPLRRKAGGKPDSFEPSRMVKKVIEIETK